MTGSDDKLGALLETMEALAHHRRYHKVALYVPYPKQAEFHALGATKRERLLRAGNQEGKTYSAAAETSFHLTGQYPDDWKGYRFDHPVRAWASGESSVVVRDTMQKLLCGQPGVPSDFGTGFIPKDAFRDRPSLSRGVTDAFDTIQVQHQTGGVNDGISTLSFKSYEQGRLKFQSDTIDFAWNDEEPPEDIYSEILTRTTATNGIVYTTFTPLQGKTALLSRFMDTPTADRGEVVMTIYDALHIKAEDRAKIIAGWPAHERDARSLGTPMMGEGRVFPFPDTQIEEDPIVRVPPEWLRLWGIDFGSGMDAHPFAACLVLWDRETDTLHVHATVKSPDPLVSHHAALMKQIAAEVKVAWPHDGNSRERGAADETTTTAMLYRRAGLKMLGKHSTFPDGGMSTEAGVNEMFQRISSGKLKVARQLMQGDFGNEFRNYHRKDGLLVKVNDDLMSSLRMVIMSKTAGDVSPLGPNIFAGRSDPRRRDVADGLDFDLFAS